MINSLFEAALEIAIEERLRLTDEERIEAHENARQLFNDLKTAGDFLTAGSSVVSLKT